eukprot:3768304-Alexandrium_andersonii.AAC.1
MARQPLPPRRRRCSRTGGRTSSLPRGLHRVRHRSGGVLGTAAVASQTVPRPRPGDWRDGCRTAPARAVGT